MLGFPANRLLPGPDEVWGEAVEKAQKVASSLLCCFFDRETEIAELRLQSGQRSFHRGFRPLGGQRESMLLQMEELIIFCEEPFFDFGVFGVPSDQFGSECCSFDITRNLFEHVSARRCLNL